MLERKRNNRDYQIGWIEALIAIEEKLKKVLKKPGILGKSGLETARKIVHKMQENSNTQYKEEFRKR